MTQRSPWTLSKHVCKKILGAGEKSVIPPADTWRTGFLWRLLTERLDAYYKGEDEDYKQLTILIDSLVTN